eukprot:scaffold2269_cov221-Pinguiococcus_pyrenoidosus.AAC.17
MQASRLSGLRFTSTRCEGSERSNTQAGLDLASTLRQASFRALVKRGRSTGRPFKKKSCRSLSELRPCRNPHFETKPRIVLAGASSARSPRSSARSPRSSAWSRRPSARSPPSPTRTGPLRRLPGLVGLIGLEGEGCREIQRWAGPTGFALRQLLRALLRGVLGRLSLGSPLAHLLLLMPGWRRRRLAGLAVGGIVVHARQVDVHGLQGLQEARAEDRRDVLGQIASTRGVEHALALKLGLGASLGLEVDHGQPHMRRHERVGLQAAQQLVVLRLGLPLQLRPARRQRREQLLQVHRGADASRGPLPRRQAPGAVVPQACGHVIILAPRHHLQAAAQLAHGCQRLPAEAEAALRGAGQRLEGAAAELGSGAAAAQQLKVGLGDALAVVRHADAVQAIIHEAHLDLLGAGVQCVLQQLFHADAQVHDDLRGAQAVSVLLAKAVERHASFASPQRKSAEVPCCAQGHGGGFPAIFAI